LAIVRLTRAAVTRHELEAQTCTVAMPVLGPGGGALAAIELTVPDLGATTLKPALTALTLATRSLARELTGASCPTRTTGPTAAPAAILVAASIVSRSPSSMTSPHRRASATTGTSPAHDWSFARRAHGERERVTSSACPSFADDLDLDKSHPPSRACDEG
jgi:hypothetical protein